MNFKLGCFVVFKSFQMNLQYYPSNSRGHADYGWLKATYSFSFSEYYKPSRMHFGVLRVLNDDIVAPNSGFDTHPHQNMEIITIPFKGAIKHADSTGGQGLITAGEIQVMSAGTGIYHSEHNGSSEDLNLFQIWIFPRTKDVQPRYDQQQISNLLNPNELSLVVSGVNGNQGLYIHQDAWLSLGKFDQELTVTYKLNNPANGVFAIVIEGTCQIENVDLSRRDAVEVTDSDQIILKTQPGLYVLFIEVPLQ
jgi:redox-sensitive bicupin YhaK (pirin superfamily)